MKRAYEQGFDWLWLMDDDTIPKAKALRALLEAARLPLDPRPRVLASRQLLPNGLPHPTTAFVNPTDPRHPFLWLRLRPRYRPIRWALFTSVLLHRSLVEEHGLPHKAFFIWEDDLEYTARALRRGLGLQVRDSEVIHKSASKPYISATTGENRLFYGVRNRIWVLRSPAFGPLGRPSSRSSSFSASSPTWPSTQAGKAYRKSAGPSGPGLPRPRAKCQPLIISTWRPHFGSS